jgi:hypothetical protein
MSVDQTAGQARVAARRPAAALVALAVLLVAAIASAASWARYTDDIADINPFFAELAVVTRIVAVLYGVLAGLALVGVVVLLVGRPRLGPRLLMVALALTVPGQALILYGVVADNADVLDGSGRIIGEPSVALATVQLVSAAAALLATGAALVILIRRHRTAAIRYGGRVNVQVLEGSLVEAPAAGVGAVDRRAFGEFVGPRGELASYAFGWITGSEDHVARLSIGIGAGNPGGGTFHAVMFPHEDGHAFSLTDERFERVPEGGPDLTADQARAHVDLPFVWWVADSVIERDRRAWWMRHWLLGTTSIQTAEVFARREPVLLVGHDADDGIWQLIGTTGADSSTGKIEHLHHAVDDDRTLIDVLDLRPGHSATRNRPGGPWTRHTGS